MPNNETPRQSVAKNIIYIVILVMIGLVVYSYINPAKSDIKEVTISEISQQVAQGQWLFLWQYETIYLSPLQPLEHRHTPQREFQRDTKP